MHDFVPVMPLDEQIKELREICKEMHEIEEATERVEVNSRFHTHDCSLFW